MKNKKFMIMLQSENDEVRFEMEEDSVKFRELIYELMNGYLDLEKVPIEESRYIKDEFAEGEYCETKYREVCNANMRLCKRLGNYDEDEDVETIINCLLEIQEHLCMKMFDYGWMFALREKMQKTDH